MKTVAKLVEFSLMARVVVEEGATQDEIIKASYKKIQDKIDNEELGDNLVECDDDLECPSGTFETDNPSIDKVILNVEEKTYIVIGKGLPVQIKKFQDFSDWDSVKDIDGEPIFDVQIDAEEYDCKCCEGDMHYNFQYVNLIWSNKEKLYRMGLDYDNPKELIITEVSIAQVVADLLEKEYKKIR